MSKREPGSNDNTSPAAMTLDGRERITFARGDSVATAMIAHGSLMTSRSPKYRRPRGAYCLDGDCGSCLMRIDGRPNQRACMTRARPGMELQRQNTFEPTRLDPTAMVDRMFPGHFDHHHFMLFPRVANQMMQSFARQLAGFGTLPDANLPPDDVRHRHHAPQVLVIGASTAGRAAFETLRAAGIDAIMFERHAPDTCRERRAEPSPSGAYASQDSGMNSGESSLDDDSSLYSIRSSPLASPSSPTRDQNRERDPAERTREPASSKAQRREFYNTGVFAAYPDESIWAASELHPGVEILHTVAPRAVLLCTGARDPMIPLPDNDKPGIVAARGLLRSLAARETKHHARVVVIGSGRHADDCAAELRAYIDGEVVTLEPSKVRGFAGSPHVQAVLTDRGREACSIVALAERPAPAYELAAQAGASVYCDGSGFAVSRDGRGFAGPSRCGAIWVAGDVSGFMGRERALQDGERVAKELIAWLSDGSAVDLDALRTMAASSGAPSESGNTTQEVTP